MSSLPRRLLFLPVCAASAAIALGAAAPSAQAASLCPDTELRVTEATTERAEAAVRCLVNVERAARGLPGVGPESHLRISALGHALDMILRGFFAHEAPSGTGPGDRIENAGYDAWAWGENLAAGQATPRHAMEAWMASEGHCRNVLESDFTQMGVAVLAPVGDRVHWVQNYGLPKGQLPPDESDAASACPVVGLADGVAPASPPDASTASERDEKPSVRYKVRRSGKKLRVSGRIRNQGDTERVRIRLRRSTGKSRVLYRKTRSDGTFSVRVTPPRGRGDVKFSVRPRA